MSMRLIRALGAVLAFAACVSHAQTGQILTGTINIVGGAPLDTVTFTCFGRPTCSGTYSETVREVGCSNAATMTGNITITGVNLATSGPISGDVTISNDYSVTANGNGTCTYVVIASPFTVSYAGTWNGTSGAITLSVGAGFTVTGTLSQGAGRTPQVFPMTVTGNIGANVSNASATFQPRPQDAGTQNSVYVFAYAPSSIVLNAAGEKDGIVQCVLAQLNASGQLQAVSPSSLQAYVTGVLTGQGQAITIFNNVATANIGGAAFFLGYGTTSSGMINSGVNQVAIKVPASGVNCDPQPAKTGWWWSTREGGRGYSLEQSGNTLFFAAYLYDASGRATWTIAAGPTSLDGSLFTGRLEAYAGGQSLAGAFRAPGPVSYIGDITLAFSDGSHGTMVWPGGTVAIERFDIAVPGGQNAAPLANQPENGWWWNPAEPGRGFFIEWQAGSLFMAGYMYDDAGNPIWYLSWNGTPMTNLQAFSSAWAQYANGQTLTGTYRAPTQVNANVAPVTIQFQGAADGIMTLPGGRTTAIRRYRF